MSKIDQDKIISKGIYLVKEDVYIADPNWNNKKGTAPRVVIIPEGELLEFRFFSPAHFRDMENNYFPISDNQLKKIEHVAEIWDRVFFNNNASLKEVLTLKLYDEDKSFKNQVANMFTSRGIKLKEHLEKLDIYYEVVKS